jgi:two-component system sensor histidine kinase HydH
VGGCPFGPSGQKGAPGVWEQEFLDELCAYIGFTPAHAAQLAAMRPLVQPGFDRIVDRFYEAVQQNPRASSVFTGGLPQIERQKSFLRAWLEGVVSGVYDVEYLRLRARIGRTHVKIRLDQRYMFAAMNIVREGLHEALTHAKSPEAEQPLAHQAIDKICDLELAIMLQTYSEDYVIRMRDTERLATLGQLAGFIGHELRNPLAVMETSLHLLKKRLDSDDEHLQRHLRRLSEQVQTSSGIISDLLELARDRPLERTLVDVRAMLEESLSTLPLEPDAMFTMVQVPADLPAARLDAKQVQRLVANLATNAAQAMSGVTAERRFELHARREGDVLVLVAKDTGPGISEEVRHRLFEPLATTRAKGLGLGLALCRRIAEKHGGEIRAHNQAEGGALFEVRLAHAF